MSCPKLLTKCFSIERDHDRSSLCSLLNVTSHLVLLLCTCSIEVLLCGVLSVVRICDCVSPQAAWRGCEWSCVYEYHYSRLLYTSYSLTLGLRGRRGISQTLEKLPFKLYISTSCHSSISKIKSSRKELHKHNQPI